MKSDFKYILLILLLFSSCQMQRISLKVENGLDICVVLDKVSESLSRDSLLLSHLDMYIVNDSFPTFYIDSVVHKWTINVPFSDYRFAKEFSKKHQISVDSAFKYLSIENAPNNRKEFIYEVNCSNRKVKESDISLTVWFHENENWFFINASGIIRNPNDDGEGVLYFIEVIDEKEIRIIEKSCWQ